MKDIFADVIAVRNEPEEEEDDDDDDDDDVAR